MPTYVYHCDTCGKSFEQFQSFKDEPLHSCPWGHDGTVRRVFQPVGIVFKGSGWYINDSRNSSSSSVVSGSNKEKAESSEKSSDTPAKSDSSSTPATTAPTTTSSSNDD